MKLEHNDKDLYDDEVAREKPGSVACECGQRDLMVNWIPASYTGGYLKVTCPKCGGAEIVLDDYA